MSQNEYASCRTMVCAQMERQSSLNLDRWSSHGLRVDAEAMLAAEVHVMGQLRAILTAPHVEKVRVRGSGSYDKGSDEIYYSADVTVEVLGPDGSLNEISYAYELDGLEHDIQNMDDDDPQAIGEYRSTLSALKSFLSAVADNGELNHADFWKANRADFSVTRDQLEIFIDDGDLDVVGLADDVFGRKRPPIELSQPPARWTSFELYRVARRLKAGMSPDAMDEGGLSPLNAAVWQGANSIVHKLLAAGADPNAVDVSGVTPLATAVHMNRLELIDALLNAGADLDGPLQSRTALFALNTRRGVPIEELLKRGLNLDLPMPDGGKISASPERYCPQAHDARVLRSHLTTGAIESAMSGGDGRPTSKSKDFTL